MSIWFSWWRRIRSLWRHILWHILAVLHVGTFVSMTNGSCGRVRHCNTKSPCTSFQSYLALVVSLTALKVTLTFIFTLTYLTQLSEKGPQNQKMQKAYLDQLLLLNSMTTGLYTRPFHKKKRNWESAIALRWFLGLGPIENVFCTNMSPSFWTGKNEIW